MVTDNKKENELHLQGFHVVAGCDESGMGCFAGDVVVGIVAFSMGVDYKILLPDLNDSKQKTAQERDILYQRVHSYALSYATATASVEEIDRINIYWARFLAVYRAIRKMSVKPEYIIIDGNKIIPSKEQMMQKIRAGYADKPEVIQQLAEELEITLPPQEAIVKGDGKCISIAAASILAKVERDKHIDELAKLAHPDYNWVNNKSYYCPKQVTAIKKYGKTIYHREKYVRKYLI
ncbi:MAG: ribonuclease HII [Patescibacteria group bacterium]